MKTNRGTAPSPAPDTPRLKSRLRRALGVGSIFVVLLGLGGVAGWSLAHVTGDSTAGRAERPAFVTTVATHGVVKEDVPLDITAQWASQPLVTNQLSGVVTDVKVRTGDRLRSGDVLYSANLLPVTIAEGKFPLFRDVEPGLKGADVANVQSFLADQGLYAGPTDGAAGAGTVAAIRAWQKSVGSPESGVIEPGRLLMVPRLPVRAQVDTTKLRVGAKLAGGEDVVRALATEPSFTLTTSDQVAQRLTAQVEITIAPGSGAGAWSARAGASKEDPQSGQIVVRLRGPDGGSVCGTTCQTVPYGTPTTYPAKAVVVPEVSGTVLPAAAVVTDGSGSSVVVADDGRRLPVTVRAVAGGLACISGVQPGQRVRLAGAQQT